MDQAFGEAYTLEQFPAEQLAPQHATSAPTAAQAPLHLSAGVEYHIICLHTKQCRIESLRAHLAALCYFAVITTAQSQQIFQISRMYHVVSVDEGDPFAVRRIQSPIARHSDAGVGLMNHADAVISDGAGIAQC